MILTVHTKQETGALGDLYGLFFEDISHAADGGLYAEMLENRNFESLDVYGGKDCDYYAKYDGLYAWSSAPNLQMGIVQGSPVSECNPHYLRLTCGQGGGSFWNQAYSGIHMRPGVACRVSFYARCVQYQGSVTVAVAVEQAGAFLLSGTVALRPAGADGWKRWERYELTLRSGSWATVTILTVSPGRQRSFLASMPRTRPAAKNRRRITLWRQPATGRYAGAAARRRWRRPMTRWTGRDLINILRLSSDR